MLALSILLTIVLGKYFISIMEKEKLVIITQGEYVPQKDNKDKININAFFGIVIFAITNSVFFIYNFNKINANIVLIVLTGFFGFLIGLYDDIVKIKKQKGISATKKFVLQNTMFLIPCAIGFFAGAFKTIIIFGYDIGIFASCFVYLFVINATSNAFNLTDGLDELCTKVSLVSLASLLFIISNVLHKEYIVCIIGSLIGFLYFNSKPARAFMGDCGSLMLGATISCICLNNDMFFLIILICFIPFIETVSVIMQVFSYKKYGKRIFLMSPIHHHFEKLGWSESQISNRFTIAQLLAVLLFFIYKQN